MHSSQLIEPARVARSRLTCALRAALQGMPAADARQSSRFGSRSAAHGKPLARITAAWRAAGKMDGKLRSQTMPRSPGAGRAPSPR